MTVTDHTTPTDPAADGPASPMEQLLLVAAQVRADQEEAAQLRAAHHVRTAYPTLLHQFHAPDAWRGRRELPQCPAAAVAYLGRPDESGAWLVHTARPGPSGPIEQLLLVTPCGCGAGYLEIELDGEQDLMDVLHRWHAIGAQPCEDQWLCSSVRTFPDEPPF